MNKSFMVRVCFKNGNYGNLGVDAKSKKEAKKIIRESMPKSVRIGQAWEQKDTKKG